MLKTHIYRYPLYLGIQLMKFIVILCTSIFLSAISLQSVYAIIDEAELQALLAETKIERNADSSFEVAPTRDSESANDTTPAFVSPSITTQLSENAGPTENINEVITWMYKNGLTSFSSPEAYNLGSFVTREQMAKMIVSLALTMSYQRGSNPECGFKDIYTADRTLIPYIISACNMRLLNGVGGLANPQRRLTKGEAIVIIMRLIRADLDTNAEPRYRNHVNTARAYGITADTIENMEKQVTREEIARFLYRAYNFKK